MISGAHAIIYTKNAEADKAFFRDVLKLPNVDVGRGWLIFGLPPSEIAMHPTDEKPFHELYLMCDDIELFISEMTILRIECTPANNQGWGIVSELTLPGGGKLGVYQPLHARPPAAKPALKKPAAKKAKTASRSKSSGASRKKTKTPAGRPAKKAAAKTVKKASPKKASRKTKK